MNYFSSCIRYTLKLFIMNIYLKQYSTKQRFVQILNNIKILYRHLGLQVIIIAYYRVVQAGILEDVCRKDTVYYI